MFLRVCATDFREKVKGRNRPAFFFCADQELTFTRILSFDIFVVAPACRLQLLHQFTHNVRVYKLKGCSATCILGFLQAVICCAVHLRHKGGVCVEQNPLLCAELSGSMAFAGPTTMQSCPSAPPPHRRSTPFTYQPSTNHPYLSLPRSWPIHIREVGHYSFNPSVTSIFSLV